MAVIVRPERPDDAAAVRAILEAAFDTPLEARLVDALRDVPDALALVATAEGEPIGHILFTPVTVEPPIAAPVAGLGPMAVRPDRQRRGVGSALVRAGLDACRRAGHGAVVVIGHPTYYPRFGFVPAHTRGLASEHPVPPEALMVLELAAGALPDRPSVVRFREELSID